MMESSPGLGQEVGPRGRTCHYRDLVCIIAWWPDGRGDVGQGTDTWSFDLVHMCYSVLNAAFITSTYITT